MAISYKNYLATSVGTVATDVLTASYPTTVIGLTLANITAAEVTATVTITSGATTANVIKNVVLKVGNTLDVVQNSRLILEQGDILTVVSSAATSVDVVVSAMEIV